MRFSLMREKLHGQNNVFILLDILFHSALFVFLLQITEKLSGMQQSLVRTCTFLSGTSFVVDVWFGAEHLAQIHSNCSTGSVSLFV